MHVSALNESILIQNKCVLKIEMNICAVAHVGPSPGMPGTHSAECS